MDPERPAARPALAVPVEIAPVVARLDDLLGRLDRVVARERATVAALAHELRTPVAGLRTALEVAALDDPASPGARLAARCLPTVEAMQTVIANLLALARIEAGQGAPSAEPVALAGAVAAAWREVVPRAAARGLVLAPAGLDGVAVLAAPGPLAMVLGNLLGNAVDHGAPGALAVEAEVLPGGPVRLRVANPCAGAGPDPERVFEPFWRADPARATGSHCGLGLALVQRLVRLLGGTVRADSGEGRFAVVVELPLAPPCEAAGR